MVLEQFSGWSPEAARMLNRCCVCWALGPGALTLQCCTSRWFHPLHPPSLSPSRADKSSNVAKKYSLQSGRITSPSNVPLTIDPGTRDWLLVSSALLNGLFQCLVTADWGTSSQTLIFFLTWQPRPHPSSERGNTHKMPVPVCKSVSPQVSSAKCASEWPLKTPDVKSCSASV